jgi:hypothetical protein
LRAITSPTGSSSADELRSTTARTMSRSGNMPCTNGLSR